MNQTTPTNNTTNVWASVQNDEYYDLIPVASFVTNAVDLGEKMKMAWNRAYPPKEVATPPAKAPDLDQQHYYRHLQEKSVFRCVVAMVPVLGNLCIYLYDRWNKDYDDYNKMVDLIQKQKTNSGVVETFKKASLELRCDQKFIDVVEAQLIANLVWRYHPSDAVINFTDLLTNAGDEVAFSRKLFENRSVLIAAHASMSNLKYEELPKKYQQIREICEALTIPEDFRKLDPNMPGYLDIAQKAISSNALNLREVAKKVVLDYRRNDHKQFLAAIARSLRPSFLSHDPEDKKWCDNFVAGLFALQVFQNTEPLQVTPTPGGGILLSMRDIMQAQGIAKKSGAEGIALGASTEPFVNNRAWMVDLVAQVPDMLELMKIHAIQHKIAFLDRASDVAFMEAVVKKNPAAAIECDFDVMKFPEIRDALVNSILENKNILAGLKSSVKTPAFLEYVETRRKKN